jgi:hypothetical protein
LYFIDLPVWLWVIFPVEQWAEISVQAAIIDSDAGTIMITSDMHDSPRSVSDRGISRELPGEAPSPRKLDVSRN